MSERILVAVDDQTLRALREPVLPEAGTALTLSTYRGATPTQAEVVWAGPPGTGAPNPARCSAAPSMCLAGVPPMGESPRPLEGRKGDIGRQGLLLQLPEPLPVGTDVIPTLQGPAGALVAVGGYIAWVEPGRAGLSPTALHHSVQLGAPPGGSWEALQALVAGWLPEDGASAPDPPGTGTGAAAGPGTAGPESMGGQ
jgi:hypothetical protein